jgi:hypothetical protein
MCTESLEIFRERQTICATWSLWRYTLNHVCHRRRSARTPMSRLESLQTTAFRSLEILTATITRKQLRYNEQERDALQQDLTIAGNTTRPTRCGDLRPSTTDRYRTRPIRTPRFIYINPIEVRSTLREAVGFQIYSQLVACLEVASESRQVQARRHLTTHKFTR